MKKKNNSLISFLFDKLYRLGILDKKEKEDNSFDLLTDLVEKKKKKETELKSLNELQIELNIFHKMLNSPEYNEFDKDSFKAVYNILKEKKDY